MAQHESPNRHVAHDSALSVGSAQDAIRIKDLEQEVKYLTEKVTSSCMCNDPRIVGVHVKGEEADGAMATANRFVNYENEIRVLQAKLRQEQRRNAAPADAATVDLPTPTMPGISRFGSFIGSRKPGANAATQPPKAREKELENMLAKEQASRISAEKRAAEVTAEIEELSVTLFQQANEMVARERKENAGLRDKVAGLEAKATQSKEPSTTQKENVRLKEKLRTMEQRETERKRRLEKLEAASRRIERAHALLRPR
nr:hypothetical protein CFP56_62183 [Quercus suber]